ncbi:MAG: urease accessory protein UreF [Gemmataceae bacterium]
MNLRLLQLGDSALPIGSYSHSWGLEAAIERGRVREPGSLENWSRLWIRHAVSPLEGVIVASVCRSVHEENWSAARRANELLWTSLTPLTLRNASRDMGEQLLSLAESWSWASAAASALRDASANKNSFSEWHHAPVFASLAATAHAGPMDAVLVYLHQAALGMISAGVRAVPIGHTHGQQILAALHEDIRDLAHELAERDLETAGSFCPAYEVLCHAQSYLYTRLFRS